MEKVRMAMAGIILVSLSFTTQAQDSKFILQINGGGGISSLRNDLDYDLSYSGELQARYILNNHFSTILGIGFEQIGVREDITYYDQGWQPMYTYATRKSFDYLKVPLLLRAETGNKTKYFITAGFTYGHLLNRKNHYTDQTDDALYIQPIDTYRTPNIALSAGAGMQFAIGEKTGVGFEIRENFGLIDISTSNNSAKTQSLHLLAGLNYRL